MSDNEKIMHRWIKINPNTYRLERPGITLTVYASYTWEMSTGYTDGSSGRADSLEDAMRRAEDRANRPQAWKEKGKWCWRESSPAELAQRALTIKGATVQPSFWFDARPAVKAREAAEAAEAAQLIKNLKVEIVILRADVARLRAERDDAVEAAHGLAADLIDMDRKYCERCGTEREIEEQEMREEDPF